MDRRRGCAIAESTVSIRAITSRAYLGNPKVPTVSVYQLVEGQYQVQKFRGSDRIFSKTFSELELTLSSVDETIREISIGTFHSADAVRL